MPAPAPCWAIPRTRSSAGPSPSCSRNPTTCSARPDTSLRGRLAMGPARPRPTGSSARTAAGSRRGVVVRPLSDSWQRLAGFGLIAYGVDGRAVLPVTRGKPESRRGRAAAQQCQDPGGRRQWRRARGGGRAAHEAWIRGRFGVERRRGARHPGTRQRHRPAVHRRRDAGRACRPRAGPEGERAAAGAEGAVRFRLFRGARW